MGTRVALSRSCKACIKAKQRCDNGLPQCQRCSKKSIECAYHNEPLTQSKKTHNARDFAFPLWTANQISQALWEHSLLDPDFEDPMAILNGTSTPLTSDKRVIFPADSDFSLFEPSVPSINLTFDPVTLCYIVEQFKSFPTMFAQGQSTPFLHSHLYKDNLPNAIQDAFTACASHTQSSDCQRSFLWRIIASKVAALEESSSETDSLESVLASTQALILYQIVRLFDYEVDQLRDPDADMMLLAKWSRRLWELGPTEIQSSSKWQAWLVAESVRRTLFISYLLLAIYAMLRQGYCVHTLFAKSLPFDLRTQLWNLECAEDWEALSHGVYADLISYREYTTKWDDGQLYPHGLFEKMLIAAYKGKRFLDGSLVEPSQVTREP